MLLFFCPFLLAHRFPTLLSLSSTVLTQNPKTKRILGNRDISDVILAGASHRSHTSEPDGKEAEGPLGMPESY